jgi:hypothetical protein
LWRSVLSICGTNDVFLKNHEITYRISTGKDQICHLVITLSVRQTLLTLELKDAAAGLFRPEPEKHEHLEKC